MTLTTEDLAEWHERTAAEARTARDPITFAFHTSAAALLRSLSTLPKRREDLADDRVRDFDHLRMLLHRAVTHHFKTGQIVEAVYLLNRIDGYAGPLDAPHLPALPSREGV